MKRVGKAVVSVATVITVLYLASYLYRETHSQTIALRLVRQYCDENGYDPRKVTGPKKVDVGGCPVSYTWTYRDPSHHLQLLVSFDSLYDSKLAIWDDDRKD